MQWWKRHSFMNSFGKESEDFERRCCFNDMRHVHPASTEIEYVRFSDLIASALVRKCHVAGLK